MVVDLSSVYPALCLVLGEMNGALVMDKCKKIDE